jgi:hypothetical protein
MKQVLLFCSLIICFLAMGMNPARIPQVKAFDGLSQLSENVMVVVNCTEGSVTIGSGLTSSNASLMHFPSEVDLNDTDLMNVTMIGVMFSTAQSSLMYLFNGTDPTTAKLIADGFLDSMSSAFSTDFVWFSTGTTDSVTNVTYTGPGKLNLAEYVEWLMSQCLVSDLEGFSLTFVPMSHEPGAYTAVAVMKDAGSFDWTCLMMTGYVTTITAGSGDHVVDVLDLLDVGSLAPSNYATVPEMGYSSVVTVMIASDSPVDYVSSEPGTTTDPAERGWYIFPIPLPPWRFYAIFYFGSSPSPQSPLMLTFSGVVVPEFTTPALLALFLVSAMATLIARKRFSK